MTFACEVWLRREFLITRGIPPSDPPCSCPECPPDPCPRQRADDVICCGDPMSGRDLPTPADVTATEQRRFPDGDH